MSNTPPADVLTLRNLTKTFGRFRAVQDVSFSVGQGEIFGFLGPNGAGKSTTIRMVLDILRPTSGSVTLFGLENSGRNVVAAHRRLGYLSGDMVMDLNLTGGQYLEFVAGQYGRDCRERRQAMAQLLQADLSRKIGDYSRGNRQKIGLIAALQHEPELLILDEPTSGFDPLVQEQFATLIRQFRHAGGSVLMSSHILSEVQLLCDRVAFIKDGRIINVTSVAGLTDKAAKRVRVRAPLAEMKEMRMAVSKLAGAKLRVALESHDLEFSYGGNPKPLLQLLSRFNVQDVSIAEPELEEIFMHYYENNEAGDPS